MNFCYETEGAGEARGAVLIGAEGDFRILSIPERVGGLPVRSIARNAFAGRCGAEELRIPGSIAEIGEFAFHDCARLERLELTDYTTEIGSGAFRGCGALSLLVLRVKQGSFAGFKDILSDLDQAISAELWFPDGMARLFFPAFVNDFDEDTMARAIHPRIEGCGYIYRETVTRRRIDFRGYDRLFPRAVADGRGALGECAPAVEIAFSRLQYPYQLSGEAEAQYQSHLRDHAEELVPELIHSRDVARLRLLAEQELLSSAAAAAGLRTAAEERQPELCGLLMEYGRGRSSAGKGTRFSLDEL